MAQVAPMPTMSSMHPSMASSPVVPPPPSDESSYSSFLDDFLEMLDLACCGCAQDAAGSNNNPTAREEDGNNRGDLKVPVVVVERRHGDEEADHPFDEDPHEQQRQQQRQVQQLPLDDWGGVSQPIGQLPLPETTILPHLRFHPLPSVGASSCSSLKDFFDLFLADEAPHPFRLFHETNGDENVQVSPWRTVTGTDTAAHMNTNNDDLVEENGRMDRTIKFQTNITPGSSSNPLSQSEHTTHNVHTTIPLGVTIVQSLSLLPKKWILECEFSFDFHTCSDNNIGVGKKLGTGLGQYFMGHLVKGSAVNVSVTLSECDETDVKCPALTNPSSTHDEAGRGGAGRGGSGNDSISSVPLYCIPERCAPDNGKGFLSCLSHPLLLPPQGLCSGGGGGRVASYRGTIKNGRLEAQIGNDGKRSGTNPSTFEEEQAQAVGASLLSAIKAKNAPIDAEFGSPDSPIISEAAKLAQGFRTTSRFEDVSSWIEGSWLESSAPSKPESKRQEPAPQQDVLACTSRGSLKLKHMPSFSSSFDLERASSSVSTTMMRRMLLEKGRGSSLTIPSVDGSATNGTDGSLTTISLPPSSLPQDAEGLSMRIEMELTSPPPSRNPSVASSLSASISRPSPSASDEKVRRGLKKRIARQWITWAESWCMRLWEEASVEISRREAMCVDEPQRRRKVNVRPVVRRIGQPRETNDNGSPKRGGKDCRKLWVGDADGERSDRSAESSLDRKDERGVEVSCSLTASSTKSSDGKNSPTVPSSAAKIPPPPSEIRSLSTVDVESPPKDVPTKRDTGRKASLKRRLSMLKRGV